MSEYDDSKDGNVPRVTLRLPKDIYEMVEELAQIVEQPVADCIRTLVIRGVSETQLPTVAISRAQTRVLAELIYIIRDTHADEPKLLECATEYGANIVDKLFKHYDGEN